MNKVFVVYILTNHPRHTVLYVGMSGRMQTRLTEHKEKKVVRSFTARYNVSKLVYYELFGDPYLAACREREIKKWRRSKKIKLINDFNPEWKDLSDEVKEC